MHWNQIKVNTRTSIHLIKNKKRSVANFEHIYKSMIDAKVFGAKINDQLLLILNAIKV